MRPDVDHFVGVDFQHAGERSRRAAKVKRLALIIEPFYFSVPKCLSPGGERIPHFLAIDFRSSRQMSLAEHLEKVIELEVLDRRFFEIQQRVLARVHIDRINMTWLGQNIIERVTAG